MLLRILKYVDWLELYRDDIEVKLGVEDKIDHNKPFLLHIVNVNLVCGAEVDHKPLPYPFASKI